MVLSWLSQEIQEGRKLKWARWEGDPLSTTSPAQTTFFFACKCVALGSTWAKALTKIMKAILGHRLVSTIRIWISQSYHEVESRLPASLAISAGHRSQIENT